jgi:pyruvate ferredoxin oxidoreductase alpha subunit
VDARYKEIIGRGYGGLVDAYFCEDAEHIILTLGSITGLVRDVVDELRDKGEKVGVLKIRYMRPFPEEEIRKYTKNAKSIAVLEKDISFGYQGTVYTNVLAALINKNVISLNYIAGLGGRDIKKFEIEQIFEEISQIDSPVENPIKFVGVEVK